MGFTEILTCIFIVLKIIGTIDWSWWLVLLPEIIAVIVYIGFFIAALTSTRRMNREIGRMFKRSNKF